MTRRIETPDARKPAQFGVDRILGPYDKHDGPPVGEPFLFFVYPSAGMGDMMGTLGPASWSHEQFLGHVINSIQ